MIKSDYLLSLPGIVEGILAGDLIDVTDRQGTFTQCMVTDSYAGNLGTTVYFNLAKINAWITGAMKYCLMKE